MKKDKSELNDWMRPSYKRSDFGEMVRGKHAKRIRESTNVIVLEPEVAKVFPNDEAVNNALRGLMSPSSSARPRSPRKIKKATVIRRAIRGKSVYVVEGHNVAIRAWAEIKRSHPREVILITLDHHADTQFAFKRYANEASVWDRSKLESLSADRVSQIDLKDEQSVLRAATDLWNDEQIDAAMKLDLFSAAFCFNQQNRNTSLIQQDRNSENGDLFLFDDEDPALPVSNRIFEVGEPHAVGWTGGFNNDEWDKAFADQAIESAMLRQLIDRANTMAATIGIGDVRDQAYVLDIDLDYFRTMDSLAPKDPAVFHELVQRAKAITIATEPSFVKNLRLEKKLTAVYALARVMEHISTALAT